MARAVAARSSPPMTVAKRASPLLLGHRVPDLRALVSSYLESRPQHCPPALGSGAAAGGQRPAAQHTHSRGHSPGPGGHSPHTLSPEGGRGRGSSTPLTGGRRLALTHAVTAGPQGQGQTAGWPGPTPGPSGKDRLFLTAQQPPLTYHRGPRAAATEAALCLDPAPHPHSPRRGRGRGLGEGSRRLSQHGPKRSRGPASRPPTPAPAAPAGHKPSAALTSLGDMPAVPGVPAFGRRVRCHGWKPFSSRGPRLPAPRRWPAASQVSSPSPVAVLRWARSCQASGAKDASLWPRDPGRGLGS